MRGSVVALAPAERATPIKAAGAPGHVRVIVARPVPAIGWATIIVAALLHRPAPPLVAHLRVVPTPLKNAHQTAQRGSLQAMPACNVSRHCTTQAVFEAAARAGFCRAWGGSESEHCCCDQSKLAHSKTSCWVGQRGTGAGGSGSAASSVGGSFSVSSGGERRGSHPSS